MKKFAIILVAIIIVISAFMAGCWSATPTAIHNGETITIVETNFGSHEFTGVKNEAGEWREISFPID